MESQKDECYSPPLRRWSNIDPTLCPITHKTFGYHSYNVGPTSSTSVQHCINVIQMFGVYRGAELLSSIWFCLGLCGPLSSCVFAHHAAHLVPESLHFSLQPFWIIQDLFLDPLLVLPVFPQLHGAICSHHLAVEGVQCALQLVRAVTAVGSTRADDRVLALNTGAVSSQHARVLINLWSKKLFQQTRGVHPMLV